MILKSIPAFEVAEESYREFMCKLVYPGRDFAVRAKTDLENKIKAEIRPVSSDGHQF